MKNFLKSNRAIFWTFFLLAAFLFALLNRTEWGVLKLRSFLNDIDVEAGERRIERKFGEADYENLKDASISIYKKERELILKANDKEIEKYNISLGRHPLNHKAQSGDGRTPVGEYSIVTRNYRSNYHLFLGIDYPKPADAKRGLDAGIIDEKTYNEFLRNYEEGNISEMWGTELGGAIGIHGTGNVQAAGDWTEGCIAVSNAEIEELWAVAKIGTTVRIYEHK
jgi:murein L,D-transpeptidase YafK